MVRCKYSTWLYTKDAELRAGWCNCELPSKAALTYDGDKQLIPYIVHQIQFMKV